MPWRASHQSLMALVNEDHLRSIPGDNTSFIDRPFQYDAKKNTIKLRNLKTVDYIHLCGPAGMYYINRLDLHYEYKFIFNHLLSWLYTLRSRSLDDSGLLLSLPAACTSSASASSTSLSVDSIQLFSHLTVQQLQQELKHRQLLTTGKKQLLINRLMEYEQSAIRETNGIVNNASNKRQYDEYTYGLENLVMLEYLMPQYWCTFNLHLLVHFVEMLAYTGPVYGTWMFTFERYAHYLKGYIHSYKSLEEVIARAISVNEITCIQFQTGAALAKDKLESYLLNHESNRVIELSTKHNMIALQVKEKNGLWSLIQNFLVIEDPLIHILYEEFKAANPSNHKVAGTTAHFIYNT
jgi:hypothetical protein